MKKEIQAMLDRKKVKTEKLQAKIKVKTDLIDKITKEVLELREEVKKVNQCDHKFKGVSHLKEKRTWNSDVSYAINEWTGEEEAYDNGHTVYYHECQICGKVYED